MFLNKRLFIIVIVISILCGVVVSACAKKPTDKGGNQNVTQTSPNDKSYGEDDQNSLDNQQQSTVHTHSLIHNVASKPTCTGSGNIEFWKCSECGKFFADEEATDEIAEKDINLEKLSHNLTHHEGKSPTCNSVGWKEYETCADCDYTTYKEIEICGHNYVYFVCTYCGEVDTNAKPTEGLELTLFTEEDGSSAYAVTGIGTATDENIALPNIYKGLPVTKIGEKAFYKNKDIKSVLFSQNIKLIERFAFCDCDGLENLNFNDGLQKIDLRAFEDCDRLDNVKIPDSVSYIGLWAFMDCSELEEIMLSNNLKYLGKSIFWKNAFYYDETNWENGLLYADGYLLDSKHKELSGNIMIKEGTRLVASWALSNCTAASITMSNSVKYINEDAFYECTSKIIWGDSPQIEEIGEYVFSFYKNEGKFVIPSSVTKIENYAFTPCSISSIEISSNVEVIGEEAFRSCLIKEIKFNEGLTSIGDRAFYHCGRLTEVVLPNSLKVIPEFCFQECGNLANVKLGSDLKEIGGGAFQDCDKLTSIVIPKSVEFIGAWAFYQGIGGFILKSAVLENIYGWKVVNYYDKTKIKYPTYSELLNPVVALRTYNNYDWYRT